MFLFGLYSDTFDENTPPVDDPKYISSLGSAIYKGMQSGDDDAIWLMQASFMVKRDALGFKVTSNNLFGF
ncbi:unnamed protein product [Musa acuminata subsp. malaccensis]|uniref:(wild Malaysian banana) hypothetical protein n=1 Tax=Musa acuminata subsp. malaccensis TaxID=214687 RepID=A0A804HXZ7_MUSAM|nr:unnamed protein product [Musa acuminata subsp. malaccensis]